MFYIHQIGEEDCGITSLKMLLANHFQKEDYLFIHEDENHGPYSFMDLINIAKEYGMTLSGVEIDEFDLDKYPKKPFLAVITISEETKHLVYVDKIKKESFIIFDPVDGKKILKKDDFFDVFDGKALIVEDKKEIKDVKKINIDIPTSQKVLSTIVQIVSYVALVLGMMFIKNDSYIFIPIICFTIYIVLQILLEKHLTSCMKIVDDLFVSQFSNNKKDTDKIVPRLSEYKKTLFISRIKLTGDILTSLFLSVIMVINENMTFIIVGTVIFLILLNILFVNDYMKKKAKQLALYERELHLYETGAEYAEKLIGLNEGVYNLTMAKRSLRYIAIFIILLSTLITMMFIKVVSVPFVLIHVIFGLTIYDKLKDIIEYDENIDKRKVDYMKLVNLINDDTI